MKKNSETDVIYTLILLVSFLFVGSCSKPKLVYFSPGMVHSKSVSGYTIEKQQVNMQLDSTLPVVVQQSGTMKIYSFKHISHTVRPIKVWKKMMMLRRVEL